MEVEGRPISKLRTAVRFVRRNFLTVFFPSIVAYAIYSDWSRTQRFKASKALEASAEQQENTEQLNIWKALPDWTKVQGTRTIESATMKGVFTKNALRKYFPFALILCGAIVGERLDRRLFHSMDSFHNKSALFGGRQLAPGERIWWWHVMWLTELGFGYSALRSVGISVGEMEDCLRTSDLLDFELDPFSMALVVWR